MADESILKKKFQEGYAAVFYAAMAGPHRRPAAGLVQYSDRGLGPSLGHRGRDKKLGRLAFLRPRPLPYAAGEPPIVFRVRDGYRIPFGYLRIGPDGQRIRLPPGPRPGKWSKDWRAES